MLVARLVPATARMRQDGPTTAVKPDLDPVGTAILGLALLCLLTPFLLTTGSPNGSSVRWWLLVPAVLASAAFLGWERRHQLRGRQPLVPLALLRIASLRYGVLVSVFFFAAMMPGMIVTSVYLRQALGISALTTGLMNLGYAVGSGATAWIAGKFIGRTGRPLIVWGLAISILGVIVLTLTAIGLPSSFVVGGVLAAWAVGGIGAGLVLAPNQALALAAVPIDVGALAGGVLQLGQRVGTAAGVGIGLSLYYATTYGATDAADRTAFERGYALCMASTVVFFAVALVSALLDVRSANRVELPRTNS